jgi:ribosome-binding ATPase
MIFVYLIILLMKIWIVWLPNVGKSTLFNALTNNYSADAANFPFCTIEPNVGVVDVNDPRLFKLAEISKTTKIIPATINFVDIAGLVKGASAGEWLGNQFLSHIREVDAIVQVVRYFKDEDVVHVEGKPDPMRDVEIINTELIIADLAIIERRLKESEKNAKTGGVAMKDLVTLYTTCRDALSSGKLMCDLEADFSESEKVEIKQLNLLTYKPFVYAINVSEQDLIDSTNIQAEFTKILQKPVTIVSAKFESEMIGMEKDDKEMFMDEIKGGKDIAIPTLDDLIKLAFDTVGLMYYFTTGEKETRAWTIKKWFTAPQSAGVIHTDFERGFIKAEVVKYDKFVEYNGWSGAKEKGALKLEGKDYVVQDGDVMLFRFNV